VSAWAIFSASCLAWGSGSALLIVVVDDHHPVAALLAMVREPIRTCAECDEPLPAGVGPYCSTRCRNAADPHDEAPDAAEEMQAVYEQALAEDGWPPRAWRRTPTTPAAVRGTVTEPRRAA
jgi:hypothetical protein